MQHFAKSEIPQRLPRPWPRAGIVHLVEDMNTSSCRDSQTLSGPELALTLMTQREEEQEACGNFPFKFFPPYYWHTWLVCVLKDQVCKPSNTDFKKGCGARRCFFSRSQRQILAGPRWDQMVWDSSCHLCLTRWTIILCQWEGCSALRGLFLGSPGYSFCSAHLGRVASCHWSHVSSRAQLWYKCVIEVCWKTCRKVSPDLFKKKLLHPACSIAATPKSLFPPTTKRSCELTPEKNGNDSWLEMFEDGSGGSHL